MSAKYTNQSKIMSFIEATTNSVIGLMVSMTFTYWGLPLFDIHPSLPQAAGITACYFCLSVGRTYILRRSFESQWFRKVRTLYTLWIMNKKITKIKLKLNVLN
jgi:hypothetical protein